MALRSKSGGWLVAVCLLVMPSVAGPTEEAQPVRRSLLPGRPGRAIRPVRAVEVRSSRAPRVVGTLQYDNDIPFQREGNGAVIGNRFNAGFGDPHSIASFSFRPGGGATAGFWIGGFLDVNATAMTVATIGIAVFTGIPPGTVGTMVFAVPLSAAVPAHSGSFLGGIANYPTGGGCTTATMLGAPCNGVALTAGTMDPGMGFHAVRVLSLGTTGINIPNRNAVFRATGDNLPVELMQLGVQ
jgi:hypothetical protein